MLFIGAIIGLVAGAVQAAAGAAISTGLSAVGLGGRLAYGTYLNTVRAIVLLGRGAGAAGAAGGGLGGFGGSAGSDSTGGGGSTSPSRGVPETLEKIAEAAGGVYQLTKVLNPGGSIDCPPVSGGKHHRPNRPLRPARPSRPGNNTPKWKTRPPANQWGAPMPPNLLISGNGMGYSIDADGNIVKQLPDVVISGSKSKSDRESYTGPVGADEQQGVTVGPSGSYYSIGGRVYSTQPPREPKVAITAFDEANGTVSLEITDEQGTFSTPTTFEELRRQYMQEMRHQWENSTWIRATGGVSYEQLERLEQYSALVVRHMIVTAIAEHRVGWRDWIPFYGNYIQYDTAQELKDALLRDEALAKLGLDAVLTLLDVVVFIKALSTTANSVAANRLWHIFGNPEHKLQSLVAKFGSEKKAYYAVQRAANKALREGKLTPDAAGILPSGDLGNIIYVQGTKVRLIGGRVENGKVILSSFSRKGI